MVPDTKQKGSPLRKWKGTSFFCIFIIKAGCNRLFRFLVKQLLQLSEVNKEQFVENLKEAFAELDTSNKNKANSQPL